MKFFKMEDIVKTILIIISTIAILALFGVFSKSNARDYVCDNWSSYSLYKKLDNTKLFEDLVEIYTDLCVGGESYQEELP